MECCILAIADAYEAMTSECPKEALPVGVQVFMAILKEFRAEKGC
ncbi:MAG: hypothetical protein ACYC4H_08615 [Desulfocucumaceae bacterium]